MHIKQIELQGFKSYGVRVVIKDFDKQFNAITGLNGTGKSNILDAICFVLGMSNLSNIRAESLKELIYKQGQAGVNKATVAITFDNTDPNGSPVGYENTPEIVVTRQVIVGGKTKYLINGSVVQNVKVRDLFWSVQLNVNNPHFLILQGRMTKVANMKPPEILSMIEEAAGMGMYKNMRRAADVTLKRKDAKLRKVDTIMSEEIPLRLQRLQEERAQYQEYQKATRELNSLSRLHVAYVYTVTKERADTAVNKLHELNKEISNKRAEHVAAKADVERVQKEEADLTTRLDEAGGGQVVAAEKALEVAEAERRRLAGFVWETEDDLVEHGHTVDGVKQALQEDEAALADRRRDAEKDSGVFERLQSACTSTVQAADAAQQRFLDACRLTVGATICQTQKDAELQRSAAAEEVAVLGDQRELLEVQLRDIARNADIGEKRVSQERADGKRLEKDHTKLAAEFAAINFDPDEHAQLREQVDRLQDHERTLHSKAEIQRAQDYRADFQYSDPVPGFDRSKVRGVLCRLVRAVDERYFCALQEVAGDKLYNVVVDTSDTCGLILNNCNLARFTTFIPLNHIVSGNLIDERTTRLAKQLVGDQNGDKVRPALELLEYSSDVSRAVEWVFGNAFVCDNLTTATKIAYNNQIRRRCVTLDGDVCDPGGVMTGGERTQGIPVLRQVRDLDAIESQLEAASAELSDALRRLQEMDARESDYYNLRTRRNIAKYTLDELRKRLVASTRATQVREQLRTKLKDTVTAEKDAIRRHDEADARLAEIELRMRRDFARHKEKECEEAERATNVAMENVKRARQAWQAREPEYSMMHLEIEEFVRAVDEGRAKLAELDVTRAKLLAALEQTRLPLEEATRVEEEASRVLIVRQDEATGRNFAMLQLQRNRADRQAAADDARLKLQELSYSKKYLDSDVVAQKDKMKKLERDNTWIVVERYEFGLAGGPYDFEALDARTFGARLEQLKARQERLSRGLNPRAHKLLTKEEEQNQELADKRRIAEEDRRKLVAVMRCFDEKKRRALLTAVERVSQNFADIFAALLPGASARLRPPPGSTELEGLEIGVAFNNVWKRSLDELSDGERSLVMMSLVLAMLRFKPAPLCILDDVDASLDLAHTQHMGAMMRRHFTTSQFIVVSRKEGMFDNANVLFRTRFVEGFSQVERTVRQQRPREQDDRDDRDRQ